MVNPKPPCGAAIVAGTQLLDAILGAFSYKRENGTRIVGIAVIGILVLFLLVVRALSQGSRITRELSEVLEALAWEQFVAAGHPERFRDRLDPELASVGTDQPDFTSPDAVVDTVLVALRRCYD